MRIVIPEAHEPGFSKLLRLDEKEFQELRSALENIPATLYLKDLIPRIASQVEFSQAELEAVLEVLYSLNSLRLRTEEPLEKFVNDVIEGLENSDFDDQAIESEVLVSFATRLKMLFSIEPFCLFSKALSVLYEQQNSFTEARIITDLRPIFGEVIDQGPRGALILHSLHISYFSDGEQNDFYVSLDDNDIQKLITALARAKSKANSLRTLIKSAGLDYFSEEL